ncbi:copper resistance protein NlpE [Eikenella corrodens]|uniref:Copper resistance protein NlpE n=1 Tax=Eikenella corrodens TaxID=539 RepID=A0A3S9SJG7_EIKCO|nr:copper resistance protein NlpE [Eikenella corrodens]AZR59588.1 copper resistance protein NlpE [Eikenella corrodens]
MKPFTYLPALLLLAACAPQDNAAPASAPAVASTVAASQPAAIPAASAASTAAQPDDAQWIGRYYGVLPCASCEGIETTLILHEDGSYLLEETYKQRQPFTEITDGRFTWRKPQEVFQLDKASGERLYQIGNGQIWALDADGKQVEGELANLYILKQTVSQL